MAKKKNYFDIQTADEIIRVYTKNPDEAEKIDALIGAYATEVEILKEKPAKEPKPKKAKGVQEPTA